MAPALVIAAYALAAYLAGSVNLTILAARLLGLGDLRAGGSGNPGVTNLYRAAGAKAAIPVLIAELAKAFAVIRVAPFFGLADIAPAFALAYVLGNRFPVFHRLRGGKGVAAAVGTFLAINPWVMLAGGGVFILVFALSRRVSLGSLSMVFSYPLWSLLFGDTGPALATAVVLGMLILLAHRANLSRLLKGEEPKLGRAP
jgi:acyl phosphate:glycerol-3-phosphate acyltransferase